MTVQVIVAIVVAGIVGCVATSVFVHFIAGAPIWAVAKQWPKHAWSIIFAVPMPWLLAIGGAAGIVVTFAWLVAAPTIASKAYFGPKDVSWGRLSAFHVGYALAAMIVYLLITRVA